MQFTFHYNGMQIQEELACHTSRDQSKSKTMKYKFSPPFCHTIATHLRKASNTLSNIGRCVYFFIIYLKTPQLSSETGALFARINNRIIIFHEEKADARKNQGIGY